MHQILFMEHDSAGAPTGRRVELAGSVFSPLSWDELINRTLNRPSSIELRLANALVTTSSIEEVKEGATVKMGASLKGEMTTMHLGLVAGGWRPVGLAHEGGGLVLPDRCTLSDLEGRFKLGRPARMAADFIDSLDNQTITLNPILLGLEGNTRSFPSEQQIVEQLVKVATKLRSLLPRARVIGDVPPMSDAIIGIAESLRDEWERIVDFLMAIAPLMRNNVSIKRLESAMQQIALEAHRCGVPLFSLVGLCALSAASTQGGRNPARRALKFNALPYTPQHAFNAMADLRSLQLFAGFLAISPDQSPMLCTGDKDLALVWLGLNLSNFRVEQGNSISFSIDPLSAFLPAPAQAFFRQRISA